MTCIVGIIDNDNNGVVIGGDSAAVDGYDIILRKDPKVFKNGDFIIGCTSSFRMIQILRFGINFPEINRNQDIYEYMCTDFIETIRRGFKNKGFEMKYDDGQDKGGTFIVGYKNRLFKIYSDFQVEESLSGYGACGIGESYALGSLYTSKETNKIKAVKEALECAANFSTGVSGPFIILNS